MLKKIVKIIGIFFLGVGGGIFADQILWPYLIERPLFYQYRLDQRPVNVIEQKEIFIQENIALTNAIEKVEKTAVGIRTVKKSGVILEGSGLIVSSDGLVVTLADLAPEGSKTTLFWQGEKPSFQVLKRDLKENLALLKMEKTNLPTTGFADFSRIKLGDRVFLLGNVFEKGDVVKETVNEGIVRAFDEESIETNIFEKSTLWGSSLFNIEGALLGLNEVAKDGRIIAIPVSKIKNFTGF